MKRFLPVFLLAFFSAFAAFFALPVSADYMTPEEAATHKPTVLFVDGSNHIVRKANYEKHGLLADQ